MMMMCNIIKRLVSKSVSIKRNVLHRFLDPRRTLKWNRSVLEPSQAVKPCDELYRDFDHSDSPAGGQQRHATFVIHFGALIAVFL